MRLLIFTNFYPYGNTDRFIEQELPYLVKEFTEIVIFPLHKETGGTFELGHLPILIEEPLLGYSINDKRNLFIDGFFSFGNVSYFLRELWHKKAFANKTWFRNWMASTCTLRALLKRKRLNRIFHYINSETVLYFYWGDKACGLSPFLQKVLTNPIVVRFHGSDLYEETKGGYQPYRQQLLTNISVAVTISDMGKSYLQSRYPNISFDCKVFRLGTFIPLALNKPSNDGIFRIVTCSNIVKLKRLHLLCAALQQISFKVQWTVIGDGPLLDDLENCTQSLPSNVTLQFLGRIQPKEITTFYSENPVDVFINVSETEGIPVSIMEAISFGIPVIATNVGGTSEIVDESIGFLIPKDISAQALTNIIEVFHQLEEKQLQMFRQNAFSRWDILYNAERNYADFASFLRNLEE